MSSTIFTICCHILFYASSASALRIAEADYGTDLGKTTCATNSGKNMHVKKTNLNYVCNNICATPQSVKKFPSIALDVCLEKIGTSQDPTNGGAKKKIIGINHKSGNCDTYETITSTECKNGAKPIEYWALQGSIFGDPHVVNMAGEKFDILTTGTFSLLSLTRATEEELAINGTVVRFGTKCGQSFIDDLELTGGWIREFYNTKTLKVRAIQDTSQIEALQVNFGQKWQPLADLQEMAHVKKTADAIQLDLSKLTVKVGAGKHKHHGWNFLNLDVQGLAALGDNTRVGGLLGYDDHTQVLQADADCAMFASAAETDMQDQPSCLSYLKAN